MRLILLLAVLTLAACAPRIQSFELVDDPPRLETGEFVNRSGDIQPLRRWMPEGEPHAVAVALHGFNDYSNAFKIPGPMFAEHGVAIYAFDQRGFGETRQRGIWAGADRLIEDAADVARLVAEAYPDTPVYLLGHSMGGAVAMCALAENPDLPVAGGVLVAPAVWGRAHMSAFSRTGLAFFSSVIPWFEVSGGVPNIRPTDNRAVLEAMWHDPNVIKSTRLDAVRGLVDLMDRAESCAPQLTQPVLFQYGLRDDLVPRAPTLATIRNLPSSPDRRWRVAVYPDGHHLLMRDLEGDVPVGDAASFMLDPAGPLLSDAEEDAVDRLEAAR